MSEEKVLVEVSARHIHLTDADVEALFGPGYKLTVKKELSQPGQFASNEKVTIKGERGEMKLSVLGPTRPETQVELSLTEARTVGVKAMIRESGDIEGTQGITIIGPAGSIEITKGVIAAKRHIHMTPADAEKYGVTNGQIVSVKIDTDGRSLTFGDTVVRVSEKYALAMHIDTDEANALSVAAGDPTLSVTPLKGLEMLPDRIPCENSMLDISEYKQSENPLIFTVEGSSMSPEDISNGDKLLCRKVDTDAAKLIGKGKFVVIAVDKKYYESKNKELKFDYKLRHTLFRVPVGISIEQLIDSLKKITNSIFLEENQKNLEIKYNEAIGFYKDKKELMLSVTYRKGNLRYSFHPVDLIQYVAEYVLKHNGEEWRAKKLE